MKIRSTLLSTLIAGAAALPSQITLSDQALAASYDLLGEGANKLLEYVAETGDHALPALSALVDKVSSDMSPVRKPAKPVLRDMSEFDIVTMAEFPDYSIRVKSPEGLCDTSVKQYSGYLDIASDKHLFFWFFESRSSPSTDPLLLWLNGGPGCSSSTGLLFELGPCNIRANGTKTEFNPYSWNSKANIIFLDNPINVGYSYAENESINNTPDAATDVYAFLQLFYKRFSQYSKLPFHIAAESYGGHYAPNFAAKIWEGNKDVKSLKSGAAVKIPLESIMIGNGLTEPYTQFATIPDFACAPSETAIFDETTCFSIRQKVPTCQRLQSYCYSNPTRLTCVPAQLYCWSNVAGPIQKLAINPYDVRRSCDRNGPDGPLCYRQMEWIEVYNNKPEVKKQLGVPADLKFQSCNMQINQAFTFTGDGMHNSAALLPPMLKEGLRVLIYAGDKDFMCNWIGNKLWPLALDSIFQKELKADKDHAWIPFGSKHQAGEVRQAGHGAGNFTFVRVFDSGHMVPYDGPAPALDMLTRWLDNMPLHTSEA